MRLTLAALTVVGGAGWVVAAWQASQPCPEPEVLVQLVTRPASIEVPVETPIADALIDFEEQDRQNDCLWDFLQAHETELTFEAVVAAGEWTDVNGGACAMIGEDDE